MHFISTDLEFVAPEGKYRLRVGEFIKHFLNSDEAFNTDGIGIKASLRLDAAVTASHDERGEPKAPAIRAEDSDFRILCHAIEKPRPMPGFFAYPIRPARLLSGLIEGIKSAPETEPKPAPQPVATNGTPEHAPS